MKILITGIAGFLGSRLAQWILGNMPVCEVYGIDDLSCGYYENVPKALMRDKRFRMTRLGNGNLDRNHPFWQRYDIVYHTAAYAAEGLSPFIRQYNYRNNLLGSAEITNLCIQNECGRLVFTSSMAAYGDQFAPFAEHMACYPIDPYGVAKLACEHDIRAAGYQHNLDWTIIRPHNLYGPYQSIWQKYRNVLGNWMARRLQGLPILIYGDGQQRRAFSWIDDCLPCLWEAGVSHEAKKEVINLGGAKPITIKEAARILVEVMGDFHCHVEHHEPRHEVKDAWCTVDKSQNVLGYKETTSFQDGLRQMWEWAQKAWVRYPERRVQPEFNLEIDRGLYPFWSELRG